jgi:DNA-binding transcriptional ArsR family regulator
MRKNLVYEKGGKLKYKSIQIVSNPRELKSVLNPLSLEILELLWQKEAYPLEISKKLGVDEQKIYYHIRNLQKAGLIEVVSKREIKGALAKYFKTVAPGAGFELPFGEEPYQDVFGISESNEKKDVLSRIFSPFISRSGDFDGYIVVGSPDPHGPFKAHARDGHYALYLTMALGRLCKLPDFNFIKLDTDIRAEKRLSENLIIIGGPGVNLITSEFNEHLPIFLTGEAHGKAPKAIFGFDLYSDRTKRTYKDPAIGYIVKTHNPDDKTKNLLVIAGLGRRGTLAAMLALTRKTTELINKSETDSFGHVVRGIDSAGTGEIDDIEILE